MIFWQPLKPRPFYLDHLDLLRRFSLPGKVRWEYAIMVLVVYLLVIVHLAFLIDSSIQVAPLSMGPYRTIDYGLSFT